MAEAFKKPESEGVISGKERQAFQRQRSTNSSCSCSEQCGEDVWNPQEGPEIPQKEHPSTRQEEPPSNNDVVELHVLTTEKPKASLSDVYCHEEDPESPNHEPILATTVTCPTETTNGNVIVPNGVKIDDQIQVKVKKSFMERFDAWVDQEPKYIPGFGTVIRGTASIICLVVVICLILVITTSDDCNKKETKISLEWLKASLNARYEVVSPDVWYFKPDQTSAHALAVWYMVVSRNETVWKKSSGNQVWLWASGDPVKVHMVAPGRNHTTFLLGDVSRQWSHESSLSLSDGAWVAASPLEQWTVVTIISTHSDVLFKTATSEEKKKLYNSVPNYRDVTAKVQ